MPDTKLSALATGTVPDFYYGIESSTAKKYNSFGILNVKDYGALGNNIQDDTPFIQAALDAAFGTFTSPNAGSYTLNKAVYIPNGQYLVRSPASATITGAVSGTAGVVRLTLSTTLNAGFVENTPVFVAGVSGTTEANGHWIIHLVDTTHVELRGSVFANTFSGSGATMKLPCLRMRSVVGARVYGAGRLATSIATDSTNCAVFATNGCEKTIFADMNISAFNGGTAFNLDWMLADPISGGAALQSNTFFNLTLSGPYHGVSPIIPDGVFGLLIGVSGNMGSENLIMNCYVIGCDKGIAVWNANSLQQSVIGGNIAQCNYAIYVNAGSVPVIHGVGFQQNQTMDIFNSNTVGDGFTVFGCRSESQNFLQCHNGMAASVICCTQQFGTAGVFCSIEGGSGNFAGSITLQNNFSLNGTVGGNGMIFSRGNFWGNTSPYSAINTSTATVLELSDVGRNPCTVANLPGAAAAYIGLKMMVTDGSVVASGNFGAIVAGSGANKVPVYCDGTNWRIG